MDKYAVFGNPIAQSKSPFIHQAFARQTQQELSYEALLAPLDKFEETLSAFFADPEARGCNITAPFKQHAYKWVNACSEAAKLAGAVNTIVRQADGLFVGHNTDGLGLVADLVNQGVILQGANILLIGAGGAARGVLLPLMEQQPARLVIANRTPQRAEALVEMLDSDALSAVALAEMNAVGAFDIIINSTSASLNGELPPLHDSVYKTATAVYDMVYAAQPTAFLSHATRLGVPKTIDGLGMLVEQAAASFTLWRNQQPDTQAVLSLLRKQL